MSLLVTHVHTNLTRLFSRMDTPLTPPTPQPPLPNPATPAPQLPSAFQAAPRIRGPVDAATLERRIEEIVYTQGLPLVIEPSSLLAIGCRTLDTLFSSTPFTLTWLKEYHHNQGKLYLSTS
jgi:hypothetical protein